MFEAPYPTKLSSKIHTEELEEHLTNKIRMVTLELTGRCNLRCGYCIYNDGYCDNRNFSEQDMTMETAKKAIDFIATRSGDDVAVTFYGVGPLLRYSIIQECVSYYI